MKKIAIVLIIFCFGCSDDHTSYEEKMFAIADRQLNFNQIKINDILKLTKKQGKAEKGTEIINNVNSFHTQILSFQKSIRDLKMDQIALRVDINNYLDEFLQEFDPELNHESFLDGAISRGLVAIELAYIEKGFLEEHAFRLQKEITQFDKIEAHIIPEKSVLRDGETLKADLFLCATATNADKGLVMKSQGQNVSITNGIGKVTFDVTAAKKGMNEQEIVGEIIIGDTVYTSKVNYWVIK